MPEFGHFEIQGVLGSGGMGKVYRATNTKTGKMTALKLMQREMLNSEDFRKRFEKEADLNMRLVHPNIVRVFDYGVISKRPYIEMEILPNGSLDDLFKTPRKFRLNRSAELLKQVAEGLDYAHSKGIIHRDIKLENILLGEDHQPKLVDFGLARAIQETHLTRTATMLGTPLYMSPEQAHGSRDMDYKADLYSLGVMGYLLATGHYPFYDDSLLVVLNQQISMAPPMPTEVNPGLPGPLDAVLMKALAKDPVERYDSAAQFAAAFEKAIKKQGNHVTLIQKNSYNPGTMVQLASKQMQTLPTPTPQAPQKTNRWTFAAVAGVLAVVLIGGLAAFTLNGRGAIASAGSNGDGPDAAVSIAAANTEEADDLTTDLETDDEQSIGLNARPTLPPEWTAAPPQPTEVAAISEEDEDENYLVVLMDADVYEIPNGIVLATAPRGTELEAIGRNIDGGWIQVYNDDDFNLSGWVRKESLTPIDEEELANLPDNAPRSTLVEPTPLGSNQPSGPGSEPGDPGNTGGPPNDSPRPSGPGGLSFPEPIPGGRDWASALCTPLPGFEFPMSVTTLTTLDLREYNPRVGEWESKGAIPPNTLIILRKGPLCIDGVTHWRILEPETEIGGWVGETVNGEPVIASAP